MKIAVYGSSLLSSLWNGAATYYRGILSALAARGHHIVFYEPDTLGRQQHRDIDPPAWCKVVVYPATSEGLRNAAACAADADVVVKASGVGYADDALLSATMSAANAHAVRIFWDVDAPATLSDIISGQADTLRQMLPHLDAVLTYGGGVPVVSAYRDLGVLVCVPVYNAVDPSTHHPVAVESRFVADLTFLGNRLPDREVRVDRFFFSPAARLPARRFLLGGSGWDDKFCPDNVVSLGHVGTGTHNALNVSARAVLNISRESMAANGFSPATRVFEAAGAGACLMTDAWEGIDMFLSPGNEVLVVRDSADVIEAMQTMTQQRATSIGQAALRRVLTEHTYAQRAFVLDDFMTRLLGTKRTENAA